MCNKFDAKRFVDVHVFIGGQVKVQAHKTLPVLVNELQLV